MKLNKTEQKLIDRAAQSHFNPNQSAIECGLHRGRGGTGKLRPYGDRERNAVFSLLKKGLVEIVNRHTSTDSWRGYSTTHTSISFRLTAEAIANHTNQETN